MFSHTAFLLATQVGHAAAAACAQDGSDYSYAETVASDTRTVVTNHCPNHPYYNLNPNYAVNQAKTYTIPAKPMFKGTATDSTIASAHTDLTQKGGAVGVFFNAAQLYSPYGGSKYGQVTVGATGSWQTSATYAEGNTFDQCGCHGSSTTVASYHCHVPPSCLMKQLGQVDTAHSPQIGWADDGFPVYGPRGPGGVMMKRCSGATGSVYGTDVCTDDCGGYYKDDDTIDNFVYRYYVMGNYHDGSSCAEPGCPSPLQEYHPNTPVCYRGCCPTGQTCKNIAACPSTGTINGYTAAYTAGAPTINSLSVANGLPLNTGGCACSSLAVATCADANQDWVSSTTKGGASNSCPSSSTASGGNTASNSTTSALVSKGKKASAGTAGGAIAMRIALAAASVVLVLAGSD